MSAIPDPVALAAELEGVDPAAIVERALVVHGSHCAIAFSGAEDVLLLEYARRSGRPFRVFTLDTGRLHPETLRHLAEVEAFFKLRIEVAFPQAVAVERLVREKGLFSFLQDGHGECCAIRKVEPLRRVLAQLDGWMTGQRRDSSVTRSRVPVVERDGNPGRDNRLLKWNPLAAMPRDEVWVNIRALGLPYNPLFARGFASIGCEPCTRPVLPGQHEREGRWWWEDEAKKECGLHKQPAAGDYTV